MAYRVVMDRVIAPHRYTESIGAIADHETPEEELAVNERGAPLEAFRVLGRGDLLYESAEDFNSLGDVDKQRAGEVLMVVNTRYLKEHEKLGSIKKVESAEAPRQAAPADSGAPEDKSGSRRGGSKRGAASVAGDE